MAFPSSLSWRNSYFWMVSIWSSSFLDFCLIGIFPSFFFFLLFRSFPIFPSSAPSRLVLRWVVKSCWWTSLIRKVPSWREPRCRCWAWIASGRWGEMGRDGEIWMGNWDMFGWYIYFFDGISSDFGYDGIYQQQDHMGLSLRMGNLLPQIWPVWIGNRLTWPRCPFWTYTYTNHHKRPPRQQKGEIPSTMGLVFWVSVSIRWGFATAFFEAMRCWLLQASSELAADPMDFQSPGH